MSQTLRKDFADKSEQELLKEFTFGTFVRYDQFMEELQRRKERNAWCRDALDCETSNG